MISSKNGIDTLEVEVLNISPHGIWLYVKGKNIFGLTKTTLGLKSQK